MYQAKNRSTEHCKGNKTVPGKVATTCIEDGQTDRLPKQVLQYKSKVATTCTEDGQTDRLPKQAL